MRSGIKRVLVGAAMLAAVTACGGGYQSGSPAGTESAKPGSPVAVRNINGVGAVLVNSAGMTLYTNEAEKSGIIKCVDGCTSAWPPLEAATAPSKVAGVTGSFGVVKRPDGTTQLTLNKQPLYTFVQDSAPGSVKGEGFTDEFQGTTFVWHAAKADGSVEPEPSKPSTPDDDGYGY